MSNINLNSIEFTLSDEINGKPSWVNTGQGLTIMWNTAGYWIIDGWGDGTQILSTNPDLPIGEWEPSGPALWYWESTEGTCDEYIPEQLCLTIGGEQYQFELGGTLNGKNTWTGDTLTVFWNSSQGYWTIENWPQGQIRHEYNDNVPLGDWLQIGGRIPLLGEMVVGECDGNNVSITLQVFDENCEGECDGSIIVTPQGGQSPYQYTTDGINYQLSPIFNNLCAGDGTVTIKDANNNTTTESFTIGLSNTSSNYDLQISESVETISLSQTSLVKKYNYIIQTSPSLPVGGSVILNLNGINIDTFSPPGSFTSNHTWTYQLGNVNNNFASSSVNNTTNTISCASGSQTQTVDTWNYNNTLTLNAGQTFTASCVVNLSIQAGSDSSCPTNLLTKTKLQVNIDKLNNVECGNFEQNTYVSTESRDTLQAISQPQYNSWVFTETDSPCYGGSNCGESPSGGLVTLYTEPSVVFINSGVQVFSDTYLNNPVNNIDYLIYNNELYSVYNGILNLYCSVGSPCLT